MALEQVYDNKQDDRMHPVTHECHAKAAENDIYGDANREEKARCNDVHTRQGIDCRRTSNWGAIHDE